MTRFLRAALATMLLCAPPAARTTTTTPVSAEPAMQLLDADDNLPAELVEEYCAGMEQNVLEQTETQRDMSRQGFSLGFLHWMRSERQIGNLPLEGLVNTYTPGGVCMNQIRAFSPLCGVEARATVRQDLHVSLAWEGVTESYGSPYGRLEVFTSDDDLTDVQDPVVVRHVLEQRLPRAAPDRVYIVLLFSMSGEYTASRLMLPATPECYIVRDADANGDGLTDIVFYDPSIAADGKYLIKTACGDGEGRFSPRLCARAR